MSNVEDMMRFGAYRREIDMNLGTSKIQKLQDNVIGELRKIVLPSLLGALTEELSSLPENITDHSVSDLDVHRHPAARAIEHIVFVHGALGDMLGRYYDSVMDRPDEFGTNQDIKNNIYIGVYDMYVGLSEVVKRLIFTVDSGRLGFEADTATRALIQKVKETGRMTTETEAELYTQLRYDYSAFADEFFRDPSGYKLVRAAIADVKRFDYPGCNKRLVHAGANLVKELYEQAYPMIFRAYQDFENGE